MRSVPQSLAVSAGLGAVAGMRSMLAPALLAPRARARDGVVGAALGSRAASRVTPILAVLELMADKWPRMPSRIGPLPLLGRLVSGAMAGMSPQERHGRKRATAGALLGAAGALAAAFGGYHLRRLAARHRVPGFLAGLFEDAVAVTAGRALARHRR